MLACLREKKEELSSECKTEVFERQAGAADDWRTDTELFKACKVRHSRGCLCLQANTKLPPFSGQVILVPAHDSDGLTTVGQEVEE